MALNLIEKLLLEAVQTDGTYVEFVVSDNSITFICDGGSRKSTRHYRITPTERRNDETVLKNLSERNLLFSGTLKRITFTLSDGRQAEFQREDGSKKVSIMARRVTESKIKQYEYVRFFFEESFDTGIAFAVKTDNAGKQKLIPCTGTIMNGVNTTNLFTDLQFVVSGSFYIKDKSFDVRYDKENRAIADNVASVLEAAIKELFHLKLGGMPLFAILPNTMDEETLLNEILLDAVRNVCFSYPLFKNRTGIYATKAKMIVGTDEVTDLFPQEIAEPILDGKYWLEPYVAGSREEDFLLNDMNMRLLDRNDFLKLMSQEEHFDELSDILASQSDKWLRLFYVFCSKPVEEDFTRRMVVSALKNIRSIRNSRGNMCFPEEVSIINGTEEMGKKAVVIKPSLIEPQGTPDLYSDQLRDFFVTELDIKPYSQKEEIKELATAMMSKKQAIDKLYVQRLLLLANYEEAHPDEIDFTPYEIFPYESSRGLRRVRAEKLVIGQPYVREGNLLATATGRNPLWKGLIKQLNAEELTVVLAFAEKCGAIGKPIIIKQAADKHRSFTDRLYAPGKQGRRDSNVDYTIPGLEDILKRRSLQLIRLIWSALLENGDNEEVLTAEYSVENRSIINQCDSSLMMILRERTWVPDKTGKLYMPENISVNDISNDLLFDKRNKILMALNFGSGIKRKQKALKEMIALAAREGLRVIPEEEYQEFVEWKRQHNLGS